MDKDKKYNERGLELFKAKQYKQALENFNKAISIKNDNADYYRNRAYCYYEMKQIELGDKDFNEASVLVEIERALIGIDDRFTCSENYGKYLQTLKKYKDDPRFSEKIAKYLLP